MAPGRRNEEYELHSELYKIDDDGFVVISRNRLLRLLGKGNESAGTWSALLDEWEAIDGDRNELYILRLPNDHFLVTQKPLKKVGE